MLEVYIITVCLVVAWQVLCLKYWRKSMIMLYDLLLVPASVGLYHFLGSLNELCKEYGGLFVISLFAVTVLVVYLSLKITAKGRREIMKPTQD